jgi:hypothetical protein
VKESDMKRVSTAYRAAQAEKRTAAVMADKTATLRDRLAAVLAEKQAGAGTWSREHDLEAE